jgi:hypothetical protein
MNKFVFSLLLILLVTLQSCNDDDIRTETIDEISETEKDLIFQTENFGESINADFLGIISDEEGQPLANVQITIGNSNATTDINGVFLLNSASVFEKFAYIKAEKEGYIDGSRVVIPKANGISKINIVLLKKEVTARVSSGMPSEVSLPNGAQVDFSGDFITSQGDPYDGDVDVILNYLDPSERSTFLEMPGRLFAQTETNDARILETYGMISVKLFSPSGEVLNIDENSPSTIYLPVVPHQTGIAPDTIPLWYFNEVQGYWKEEGEAIKTNNKYIGTVSHFSWWNCDLPLDFVELCFSIDSDSSAASTLYYVSIERVSNNQVIYSGNIISEDSECGLIPKNEELLISIYGVSGSCNNQLIHSETFGGYAAEASLNVSFTEEYTATSLTGVATNCDGNPLTNGYIYIDELNIFSITDGIIDIGIVTCSTTEMITVMVFDYDTNQWAVSEDVLLDSQEVNLGMLNTCGDTGGTFNGDVTLLNQNEVNNFGIFGYANINGSLKIGIYHTASNIVDLTPLSHLENIDGALTIENNPNLQNLDGLNSLISVEELRIDVNSSLASITSLDNLVEVGNIYISSNEILNSLNGLNGIINASDVFVDNNNSLISLAGLESLTSAYDVTIRNNAILNSIYELSSLSVANRIEIYGQPMLASLEGLNQITDLNRLRISYNDALTDLSGLDNLSSVYLFFIGGNDALSSLSGLDNLINVTGVNIGRDLDFDVMNIAPNQNLVDFCALQNLFINGTYQEESSGPFSIYGVYIEDNFFNPTAQDIVSGNCSL